MESSEMKDRIRTIMEQAKLSQQDFAARLGISPASLSSIFTGRTNPTNNHVMAVHRAFPQINVNWLMFGEGQMMVSEVSNGGAEAETVDAQNPESGTALFGDSCAGPYEGGASLFEQDQQIAAAAASSIARPAVGGRRSYPADNRGANALLNTATIVDKQPRKIKEIRVFFDDGTYESFVPSSK